MILLVCTVVSRQGHLNVERNVSPTYCKSSSGDDVDWFWHGFIYHGGLLWLVHFNPAIVSMYHGFLRRSLVFLCVVGFDVFFYCRHPRSRYFGSVVPVYVVWAESCVNCLFHFPCVPMAFSVNMFKKNKTIDSMNQIAWPVVLLFCFEKWNIQDLIIFKPHRSDGCNLRPRGVFPKIETS